MTLKSIFAPVFCQCHFALKVENEFCGQRDLCSGPSSTSYDWDDIGKMISVP